MIQFLYKLQDHRQKCMGLYTVDISSTHSEIRNAQMVATSLTKVPGVGRGSS